MDPLRDERVAKVVRKQGMKHCCVTPWSFSLVREQEYDGARLSMRIATNSSGQLIVGDKYKVKKFDATGQFIQHFSLPNHRNILDVATDNKDNIYVLVVSGSVYEFSNTADLHHKFPVVREGHGLTVTNNKVLVLCKSNVHVYDTDGLFVSSFGEGTFGKGTFRASSITAANDGHVMVLDWHDYCVHIFSEDGHHLDKFQIQGYGYPSIAFHMLSEHVVIVGKEDERNVLVVEIFTKDGISVRSTEIYTELILPIEGVTVTRDGRIAVVGISSNVTPKVLVI